MELTSPLLEKIRPIHAHGNPRSSASNPPIILKSKLTLRLWSNNNGRVVQPWSRSISVASMSIGTSTSSATATATAAGDFVSTVGASAPTPSPTIPWKPNNGHLLMLNAVACVTAVSASCLFFAAIPTLMAFKRAAESLEKLLDVTREELPGTMAAVRLSGMEISDLTMELSDLGQEITEGVRNSTKAVRAAEDGLRRMTNMASIGAIRSPRQHHEASNGKSS